MSQDDGIDFDAIVKERAARVAERHRAALDREWDLLREEWRALPDAPYGHSSDKHKRTLALARFYRQSFTELAEIARGIEQDMAELEGDSSLPPNRLSPNPDAEGFVAVPSPKRSG